MKRYLDLIKTLNTLEFNHTMNSLTSLFQKIEDFIYYLEAKGDLKLAEHLVACQWELKERMLHDREEQWEWTFVWIRDRVLRKVGIEANASTPLQPVQDRSLSTKVEVHAEAERQVSEVQEFFGSSLASSTPNHLFLRHSWNKSTPLGAGCQ